MMRDDIYMMMMMFYSKHMHTCIMHIKDEQRIISFFLHLSVCY